MTQKGVNKREIPAEIINTTYCSKCVIFVLANGKVIVTRNCKSCTGRVNIKYHKMMEKYT